MLSDLFFKGSLSFRIVAVFSVLLGASLVFISALAAVTLRNYLTDEIDNNLQSTGQLIASQTMDELLTGLQRQILPSEFYIYIEYQDADPVALSYQQTVQRYGTPANLTEIAEVVTANPYSVPGTKITSQWRVVTMQLLATNLPQKIGTVVVALPLEPVTATVAALTRTLILLASMILLFGAVASYLLVRQSLSGLRDIEQVSREVAAGKLSERVPEVDDGTEVALLGHAINKMLTQIEDSFAAQTASEERMRQFVSDASHELRTPLATVRGYAELYRLGGVPDDQVTEAISRIESEARRMAVLVEDLLQLARLDEGREMKMRPVDLASIAINAISDFKVRDPNRQAEVVNLAGGEVESTVALADENAVTQVLTNLLGNVVTHTPAGTPVEVAVGIDPKDANCALVEVRDHGPGIPLEEQDRIFERFYRTDASRSRGSGGSGLGLAIVASIMAAHSGNAAVLETDGGGLTVQLQFLISPPPGQ
ncbi:MAG: HAMP domain-containing sensor histidine kinase [Trueperella sp.]|nr:HAMP domain-containing sensor histidine kinase [Trueperella sp.]